MGPWGRVPEGLCGVAPCSGVGTERHAPEDEERDGVSSLLLRPRRLNDDPSLVCLRLTDEHLSPLLLSWSNAWARKIRQKLPKSWI